LNGAMVRARVSTGDIELTEMRVGEVTASNTMGNILFDGELMNGRYSFSSVRGDIHIRIPSSSGFQLSATARPNSINLGSFIGMGLFSPVGTRRIEGRVGDGRATVEIMNNGGSITFTRR
jgi:hypothetical protein